MVIFKELRKNKNGTGSYSFSLDNYKAGKCGSGHNLTGDIPQGNDIYDAATANMGYPWMMFTQTQGQELIDNTNHEWTSINDMNGRKFVNKTDDSKYIFLPAGGRWTNLSLGSGGAFGLYSSTIYYDSIYIFTMFFDSDTVDFRTYNGYYYQRSHGQSIRAVRPLEW